MGKVCFKTILVEEGTNKPISDLHFDFADGFDDNGLAMVRLKGKFNFIDREGKLLSNQWFGFAWHFVTDEGVARVELNGKSNFINRDGKLLSGQWFDGGENFHDGFAVVVLNGKKYRIDKNGNLTKE